MSEVPFNNPAASERSTDHYDQIQGRVREEVTRRNLVDYNYLPGLPATILDFGGGDGRDALWLAELGHTITRRQENAESLRLETDEILRYDMVLSHGVLMYELKKPLQQLEMLWRMLKPGGRLSLLTKGTPGALQRATIERNMTDFDSLLATGRYTELDIEAQAYRPNELQTLLEHAGFKLDAWFGVRLLTDQDERYVDSLAPEELKSLIDAELALSRDENCRGMGQMLHFIAHKK